MDAIVVAILLVFIGTPFWLIGVNNSISEMNIKNIAVVALGLCICFGGLAYGYSEQQKGEEFKVQNITENYNNN